jgi:endo-1,4-beta-xylanase
MRTHKHIARLLAAVLILGLFAGLAVSSSALDLPPKGQTYGNYPAIKEIYKDYFIIGNFGTNSAASRYHMSAYAPGNAMKPEGTQNAKGTFTVSGVISDFNTFLNASPDNKAVGHTLAWYSQSPTWMWDAPPARYSQPGTYDKATAEANLKAHIIGVLTNGTPKLGSMLWVCDVVNEAISESPTTPPAAGATQAEIDIWWRANLRAGTWNQAIGDTWIEQAFLAAADVVDANDWDCRLIYNDFGLDNPNKARVAYEMVKSLNEKYADHRPNGKPLIEVLGMQGHYGLSTSPTNVDNSIKLFATIPNIKIHITELDIGAPALPTLSASYENDQAMKWAELFTVYKKYAVGSANTTDNPKVVERVSICGINDAGSGGWRGGEYALLFTSGGLAKDALIAVLDPETWLANHTYQNRYDGSLNTYPGVDVFDVLSGDSASYANIYLGTDYDVWPYATGSTLGVPNKTAFTPVAGVTYRFSINLTTRSLNQIRVRWIRNAEWGGYTDGDTANVGQPPYSTGVNANTGTATVIPANFNAGLGSVTRTLKLEIKFTGDEVQNGLIGNIGVRGGSGSNNFTVNTIVVEQLTATGTVDKLLVNWPDGLPVDKTALADAIEDADALTETDWSVGSWSALESALEAAQAIYDATTATQDEIDAATEALLAAIDALTVDKDALEEAIDEGTALLPDEDLYVAGPWSDFVAALEAAQDVYDDDAAVQSEIDAAAEALTDAITALEAEVIANEPITLATPDKVTIKKGRTVKVAIEFSGNEKYLAYTSGNAAVATVSGSGTANLTVTGVKVGNAPITVRANDGSNLVNVFLAIVSA